MNLWFLIGIEIDMGRVSMCLFVCPSLSAERA